MRLIFKTANPDSNPDNAAENDRRRLVAYEVTVYVPA